MPALFLKEGVSIDATNMTEFMKCLLSTVKNQTDKQIARYCNANCDQTRKMKIVSKADANTYIVLYNGKTYSAFSRYDFKIGDTVLVTACCGNFNDLIIN